MNKILNKETLSQHVKLFEVETPKIVKKAQPGQFVIVRIDEKGERIPLTIADFDHERGTITLIVQEVGKSTIEMGLLNSGDSILNVVGPLGHPTEIENFGKIVVVAGGIGIAPIYPICRALKQAGNHVTSILGARNKELLFWQDKMAKFSDELIVCTDDGTEGRKALVTEPLRELLEKDKDIKRVWAIGPAVMMKFVAETTRPFGVKTIVSLNTVMIDGTGMCGGCRVDLSGEMKFVCVDGPEFDAHQVQWELLLSRLGFYREDEKVALEYYKSHQCSLKSEFDSAIKT